MSAKIVIINAFEPEDTFIELLSKEYDNALAEQGVLSELFFINSMNFSLDPFPENYTYETLEPDLRRSVDAIKTASKVVFFISHNPNKVTKPVIAGFVSRLFHLKTGLANKEIWGETGTAYNKRVMIVTVIDDMEAWVYHKKHRDARKLPIHKIEFNLFGFSKVLSATFGPINGHEMNDYGRKILRKVRLFATGESEII